MPVPEDQHQAQAYPIIWGWDCAACGHTNDEEQSSPQLEPLGFNVGGSPVVSDRVTCSECHTENFIYSPTPN